MCVYYFSEIKRLSKKKRLLFGYLGPLSSASTVLLAFSVSTSLLLNQHAFIVLPSHASNKFTQVFHVCALFRFHNNERSVNSTQNDDLRNHSRHLLDVLDLICTSK